MDGREFFAELRRRRIDIPGIVFLDSISGDEIEAIWKCGNPPVIKKRFALEFLAVSYGACENGAFFSAGNAVVPGTGYMGCGACWTRNLRQETET